MKKFLGIVMLLSFLAGCSSEPKYVQPTAKGTKPAIGAAPPGQENKNVAPIGKD